MTIEEIRASLEDEADALRKRVAELEALAREKIDTASRNVSENAVATALLVTARAQLRDLAELLRKVLVTLENEWPQHLNWRQKSPEAQPIRDVYAALATFDARAATGAAKGEDKRRSRGDCSEDPIDV